MSTKELKLIDLNLLSGSSETTRIAFGSFYETVSGTYGEVLEPILWKATEHWLDANPTGYFYTAGSWYEGYETKELEETISDDVIIPNKRFPIRFWSNDDYIKDDNFWKTIWLGGEWGTSSHDPIYTDAVFDDHSFDYTLPYVQQEINNIYGSDSITDVAQITYTYNRYLRGYQNYVADLDSELLIPNMYLLKSYEQYLVDQDEDSSTYGASYVAADDDLTEQATEESIILSSSIINFVTREGNALTEWDESYFDFPPDMFESNNVALSWDSVLLENDYASAYLTSSLLLYPLSASTEIEIQNILQNIMFDAVGFAGETSPYTTIGDSMPNSQVDFDGDGEYGVDSDSSEDTHGLKYSSKIPYYATIDFDTWRHSTDDEASYVASIESNNFSQKFLKTLKEAFLEEAEELAPEETTFAVESSYYSASSDSASVQYYDIASTDNNTYRSVDYLKMLTYAHKNYISTTDNCYYIGGESYNRSAVFDKTGVYRYSNVQNSIGVIRDVVDWLESNFTVDSLWDVYNDVVGAGAAMSSKYYETLAYRVEKIGGEATGDSPTQNTIQNFWFFNAEEKTEINLRDSQVKYGEAYTYKVYAYVLVAGIKYNFSDLRLTRNIGVYDHESSGNQYQCLEFYDPTTDLPADQLYETWEDNSLSGSNTYASNSQITTQGMASDADDFLADFYVNYEPNLKLIEVPMFTKTLKVLDNPPNTFDVNPYQINDNSQTIGFMINYETFYVCDNCDPDYETTGLGDIPGTTYPSAISSADESIRSDYLNGRDILSGSYLDLQSVSRQRYFEAYRLDEKPTSISDFDGNKVSTIDLKIPSSKYTYSSADFRDRIKTNHKYYYLFRFVNEQGIPGHLSEIYETQLVNDGGYQYAVFNILFPSDLGEDVFVNPVKPLKKVFQLQPNISQVVLDTSEVDFAGLAINEAENVTVGGAEDPIWDQTFKLRLTSKKTGKKIDFNITYKIENQYDTS
tara:strand:- start:50 stop:2965 length:2916 start_codon:yes stop_codon:yes gene_type:complete